VNERDILVDLKENSKRNLMNPIGSVIENARKERNLTQEELAELSQVNLRTIQRIENNENIPRESTLRLICKVLDIDMTSFDKPNSISETNTQKTYRILNQLFHLFFIVILNLVIVFVFGFLTIDSFANVNSNFGALILSFFIPYFIITKTSEMSGVERLLKYGTGILIYGFIFLSIMIKDNEGKPLILIFASGLYLITLFYGKSLLSKNQK
jgi:transcriptional regulator with XRE-family HTH domain